MNITTKRKSKIELLRVLCMICLVAHHFTIHGNLYLNENIFVQRFSLIFAPLGKMCYVVFMVISSYFLSNANASKIYSLDRFKERYDKKLSKAYLEGRYGAIPVFKQFTFRKEG